MDRRFVDKTAVVTGAAAGLGRALALGYAGEGAGLVILDIEPEGLAETARMIEDLGGTCRTYEIDLAREQQIILVGAEICGLFPRIDVLYNNAGIAYGEINSMIDTVSMERWLHFLAVNSLAPVALSRALRPSLAAAKGCVINQSSMAAYMPSTVYGATKSLLNQMTYGLASLFGPDGIRVNAIAPGIMDTPAGRAGVSAETYMRIRAMQMLALEGQAYDIVNVGLFLGSDAARFITSEIVHCDAGNSLRGWRE